MQEFIFEKFKNHLFDSHSHISSSEFRDDLEEVVERSIQNEVRYIFDASLDIDYSRKSIEISEKYANTIFSFVGIDPDVFNPKSSIFMGLEIEESWFEESYLQLKKLIEEKRDFIVGIGETGMDFFHNRELDNETREKINFLQDKLFDLHISLAKECNLPLTIHSRFAEEECLSKIERSGTRGIFHSYTGDHYTARGILDAGWGLGVNGIVTFKNAAEIKKLYRKILGRIPDEVDPEYFYSRGIYFETDSPYLSPDGKRGERNEPANVRDIYEAFVELLKI